MSTKEDEDVSEADEEEELEEGVEQFSYNIIPKISFEQRSRIDMGLPYHDITRKAQDITFYTSFVGTDLF